MMLVVFVKKSLKNYMKEVAAEHVGTGIMGKMVCSRLHRAAPSKNTIIIQIMSPFPALVRISSSHIYQLSDKTEPPLWQ